MPSNYKKLVRARMGKTGESWATAARHVRADVEPPPPPPPDDVRTDQDVEARAATELAALEELAAAEEAEMERRKFADLIHNINAPINQMTALRDAIRSPMEKITQLTRAVRSPLNDVVRMQQSLAGVGSPLRELASMRTKRGEAAHLAERINESRVMESVRFAEQLLPATTSHLMPNPMAKMGALLDCISPPDQFHGLGKLAAHEKPDPVAVGPVVPESRLAKCDRKPAPPPDVVDLEIEPRCKRCGSVLKGELLLEKKSWTGPNKIKGEMHVEVCETCIGGSGGDPGRLPDGPKRPVD